MQRLALTPLLDALDRVPERPATGLLALAGVAQGCLEPARARRALAWAAAQRSGRWGRLALTVELLANRGRLLAFEARHLAPGAKHPRVSFEGLEHVDRAARGGGVLLLGFHLGPGSTGRTLHLAGYRPAVGGGGARFRWPGLPEPDERSIAWHDPATGAAGLFRLRRLLAAGEIVVMTGDAMEGPELFRVPLPGRPMVLRPGWFVLRRLTGAPTLPALTHLAGNRKVLTVHPPLPAPLADEAADRAACRAALTPILAEYVRRFPAQCQSLAMWPEPAPAAAVAR